MKKGFTLTEMIASILILGIVMMIAVPAVTTLTNAIRRSQRGNIISNIEVAASEYAFDTGNTIVFVDTLVNEGYLDGYDENNKVEDPTDNTLPLNCYLVKMTRVSEHYEAEFIDGASHPLNDGCDDSKLREMNEEVTIQVLANNNNVITDNNSWVRGSVTLRGLSNNNSLLIDCDTGECLWTSSGGANKLGNSEITVNPGSGYILTSRYNFQYTVDAGANDVTLTGKRRRSASVYVKIDNENPKIINFSLSNPGNATSRTATISATDGFGSGIAGYYFDVYTPNVHCNSLYDQKKSEFTNKISYTITKNGQYILCIVDNVGNILEKNDAETYVNNLP